LGSPARNSHHFIEKQESSNNESILVDDLIITKLGRYRTDLANYWFGGNIDNQKGWLDPA